MNVLILADNFKEGGLETHIYTLYQRLKQDNNVFFAFSKYYGKYDLPADNVYSGFHFDVKCSIKDFCEDVDSLVRIINENKIDVINIHPYYSLFPAMFAAHLTNTKITYTFHGTLSFNYTSKINDTLLFQYVFESTINKVFSVSSFGISTFKSLNYDNVVLFPNPIDLDKYSITKVNNNKKWALISRLDDDKYNEIIKVFEWLPNLDIDELDVYGDGKRIEELKEAAKNNDKTINFMGYVENIAAAIKDKYTGIFGTGRVAIEGLAMNYPVAISGCGSVLGVVDEQLYEKLKTQNFVAKFGSEIDISSFNKQIKEINKGNLKKYLFRESINEFFNIDNLIKLYYETIDQIEFYSLNNIRDLYTEIKKLLDFGDGNLPVYSSTNVYYLLKNYVEYYTKNMMIKNLFISYDKQIENEYQFTNEIGRLNIEINLINEKLNQLKEELLDEEN